SNPVLGMNEPTPRVGSVGFVPASTEFQRLFAIGWWGPGVSFDLPSVCTPRPLRLCGESLSVSRPRVGFGSLLRTGVWVTSVIGLDRSADDTNDAGGARRLRRRGAGGPALEQRAVPAPAPDDLGPDRRFP